MKLFQFAQLEGIPNLEHGVTLRGHSFDDASLGQYLKVLDPRGEWRFVVARQTHSNVVSIVDSAAKGLNVGGECDALITNQKGITLLIRHADCQATVLCDPKTQVIANIHCGWRGLVNGVYQKTVEKMVAQFDVNPADLLACIGPSLGPCHAEFIHYESEFPAHFWPYQVKPCYFDLWAIGRDQLISFGLEAEHIEVAGECTYADPSRFYSYRRDRTINRHATLIELI